MRRLELRRSALAIAFAALSACGGAATDAATSALDAGSRDASASDAEAPDTRSAPPDADDAAPADASAFDADTGGLSDGAYDAGPVDAAASDAAPMDGGDCFTGYGVFGRCITTQACAALGDHTSEPGFCPGPADIECCIDTPDVSDNPPVPQGWKLMQQSAVTPDMTNWAVMILHDPVTYPMWSTTTRMFGAQLVMARVEWHPPDFQNGAVHRGVTLYVPM